MNAPSRFFTGNSPSATADVGSVQDLSAGAALNSPQLAQNTHADPIAMELSVMESALRGMRDIWLAGDKDDRVTLLREMKSTMRALQGAGFTDPGWQNAALRFIQGMESLDSVMKVLRTLVQGSRPSGES